MVKMKNSLRTSCVLVVFWCLLQTQDCRGQALIGSSRPIVARVGDDVILPCFFEPPRDAEGLTLEWTRPDLDPRFVFVWRSYEELLVLKHTHFVNRAFLFQEELKHGNISLKLTNVKPKDSGVYRCFIPAQREETSVRLIISSSSSVVVSVAAVDLWRTALVLQCVSGGWFPEPELQWLDSEGRLLSVEKTVTLSDGLYDVSSRVTVERSGTFSCTVTQSSTNLTEQSSVLVSDDIFGMKFFPVIIGLTVGLVVFAGVAIISLILLHRTKQKLAQTNEQEDPSYGAGGTSLPDSSDQIMSLEKENKSLKSQLADSQTNHRKLQTDLDLVKKVQEVKRQREISERKSVIIDKFDQYGRSVSLKNQCLEDLNIKNWSVQIEVDNDRPLTYKFETSFTLRRDNTVTIWAEGCCSDVNNRYNKEWHKQDQWNTGKIAVVSLFDENDELKDRICERMYSNS